MSWKGIIMAEMIYSRERLHWERRGGGGGGKEGVFM